MIRPVDVGGSIPRITRHLGLARRARPDSAADWLVPTAGLAVTSFRPRPHIAASDWWTVLQILHVTVQNYQAVLGTQGMTAGFVNSLVISVPSTIFPVLIAALAAFAFAWIPFPGHDWLFLGVVARLVVPIQMTFVPVLNLLNPLQLTRSYAGIWLAHTAFGLAFAVFLLRNFFVLLPADLIEAARIDGATSLGIFFRIILTLSIPALKEMRAEQNDKNGSEQSKDAPVELPTRGPRLT